jgi:cyclase
MRDELAHIHQLKDSVFAVIGADGATNFGIVRAKDGSAVLIDADIRRMDEIDDALKRTGCGKVLYLVNTHENFDHSSTNDYFEKNRTIVIGTQGCWQALHEDGEAKFAEMAGKSPALKEKFPDLKMGNVQIAFAQEMTLHLPGVAARIVFAAHNGKSHSRGDAIVLLEQDRILFAGDLLYTDFHPVTVYGDIPNWTQSINHLLALDIVTAVPGHGPVTAGGNDACKAALLKFRAYLEEFYERLGEIKAGKKSPAEIESHMKSGAYAPMGKTWMVKRNIEYFLKEVN